MKRIVIPVLLFALTACGDTPKNTQNAPDAPTPAAVGADTTAVEEKNTLDANSGATSNTETVSLTGVLTLAPQNRATVSLSMSGIVRTTTLMEGVYVKKGDVVATLENPDFIALQQEFLDSKAKLGFLDSEYKRQQSLNSQDASTKKRLEESRSEYLAMKSRLDAAQVRLSLLGVSPEMLSNGILPYLEVKSPINGYAADVAVNLGKHIAMGEALCQIIDKSNPMVRLTAYEKDLYALKIGDKIDFMVNGIVGKQFTATVTSIGQMVDEANRSVEVFAKVAQGDPIFRPGMYVTATVRK